MSPRLLSQAAVEVAVGTLLLYKAVISPFLGPACRFHPTCSDYAINALRKHGLVRGCWLLVGRVLRCNPWCRGGIDPA